jgi:hypothetical protein
VWLDLDVKGGCYAEKHEQLAMSRPPECLLRQAMKCDGAVRESEDTMMSPMGAVYEEGLQDCGDLLNVNVGHVATGGGGVHNSRMGGRQLRRC